MHMNDALVSPAVAGVAGLISTTFIAIAINKVKQGDSDNRIPLMGVMGAFIFVAQMINFAIPGTGSSGHIIGGVLLSTLLGPWAGFVTLTSVLIIQCLFFADGGLMALGCNILNMGVMSCLVAYPLFFRPLVKFPSSTGSITLASIITCVMALELGATAVVIETSLSGITALPLFKFALFMLPIHLVIGVCEGLATAAVLVFVQKNQPQILLQPHAEKTDSRKFLLGVTAVAVAFSLIAGIVASSLPDGLEWSVEHVSLAETTLPTVSEKIQQDIAMIPDYNSSFAGIIGCIAVVVLIYLVSLVFKQRAK